MKSDQAGSAELSATLNADGVLQLSLSGLLTARSWAAVVAASVGPVGPSSAIVLDCTRAVLALSATEFFTTNPAGGANMVPVALIGGAAQLRMLVGCSHMAAERGQLQVVFDDAARGLEWARRQARLAWEKSTHRGPTAVVLIAR